MEADPAGDPDPQGADLARQRRLRPDPAAGMAGARTGGYPGRGTGVGHGALQGSHERPDSEGAGGAVGRAAGRGWRCAPGLGGRRRERHDRIGNELAGTVVGDLPATLDADDLDAPFRQQRGKRQDVGLAGVASQGEHRIVLEEEQLVLLEGAISARRGQRLLHGPGVAIRDPAEPGGAQAPGRRRVLLHRHALHLRTIPAAAARAIARGRRGAEGSRLVGGSPSSGAAPRGERAFRIASATSG